MKYDEQKWLTLFLLILLIILIHFYKCSQIKPVLSFSLCKTHQSVTSYTFNLVFLNTVAVMVNYGMWHLTGPATRYNCGCLPKGLDGAERGTVFFQETVTEKTLPNRTLIFTILGFFRSKPGHVTRCIDRSVLQFLETGHIPFERGDYRQQKDTIINTPVQDTLK